MSMTAVFNYERYANTGAKVIEVANLKSINNKYALAYSTGADAELANWITPEAG